jgi:phosphatidylglycerophosphatase A
MSETRSDSLTFGKIFRKAGLFDKCALVLAVWFGAGLMPKAPGTFGTLAAVPLVLIMGCLGTVSSVLFLLGFIFLAVWTSGLSGKLLEREDPGEVVIDEVAGLLLTLFFLPQTWASLSLGFVLFRFFDILKPFPIGRLERIKGGMGIVSDDLLAGIYANLLLRILLPFLA